MMLFLKVFLKTKHTQKNSNKDKVVGWRWATSVVLKDSSGTVKWDKQMTRTQQEFDVHPIKLMEQIRKQETG